MSIKVREGDHWGEVWEGRFYMMSGPTKLAHGYYESTFEHIRNPTHSRMVWSRNDRTPTKGRGWFVIDHVVYFHNDLLKAVELRFEQVASTGSAAALHGVVV